MIPRYPASTAVEVTTTFDAGSRAAWRAWLEQHHASEREIWLLLRRGAPGATTYLDAVLEGLCFGWIDGIAKRHGDATAQRFTPRRPRSNWTELNKERARRLIREGRMTEAGLRVLPDLRELPVVVPSDIRERLLALPGALRHFESFPPLYQRVRIGNIEEVRKPNPAEWQKRLENFLSKTAKGMMYGNWDDSGLPTSESERGNS
jgi:uncharacterized protein YdeI (YjbR/CyaY-like superfamily)